MCRCSPRPGRRRSMNYRSGLLAGIMIVGAAGSAAGQVAVLPAVSPDDTWSPAGHKVAEPPSPGPGDRPATLPAPGTKSPAPVPAEVRKPTLEELDKKLEALSKNLTVTTGDGDFKLVLGGAITADFLYSTERPVAPGTPFFLGPRSAFGFDTHTFDATARQTTLFGLFTGPEVFNFQTGGFVLVSLYDNSVF